MYRRERPRRNPAADPPTVPAAPTEAITAELGGEAAAVSEPLKEKADVAHKEWNG